MTLENKPGKGHYPKLSSKSFYSVRETACQNPLQALPVLLEILVLLDLLVLHPLKYHSPFHFQLSTFNFPFREGFCLPKAGPPPSKSLAVGGWKPPLHHSTAFVREQVLSAEGEFPSFQIFSCGRLEASPPSHSLPFHFPLSTLNFPVRDSFVCRRRVQDLSFTDTILPFHFSLSTFNFREAIAFPSG